MHLPSKSKRQKTNKERNEQQKIVALRSNAVNANLRMEILKKKRKKKKCKCKCRGKCRKKGTVPQREGDNRDEVGRKEEGVEGGVVPRDERLTREGWSGVRV